MADRKVKKASSEYFQSLVNSSECFADDKVCVIGIFGKGSFGHKSKAFHINSAIEKNLFELGFINKALKNAQDILPCEIEVYHDIEQRIVYLHLVSVYDATRLAILGKQAHTEYSNAESHRYWKTQEYYHACAMVFLFSVCHIMVMIHPSATFDLNYVRLFRTLASTRHQLLPQITQCLNGVEGLPDIWRQTGRPCIPRLICSFKQVVGFSTLDPSLLASGGKDTYASRAKVKTQTTNPIKKLQHSLEDQIYSIMRKARLLGSLSSSSLFTVSSNHAFVHVQPSSSGFDPVNVLLNKIAMPALKTQWAETSSLLKGSNILKRCSTANKDVPTGEATGEDALFKDYLKQQIDHLMTGDAGRDGVAEGRRGTHVEVPSCRQWAQVTAVLFDFFLGSKPDTPPRFNSMASQLDLDMKFSEGRCRKVLPLATSAYLENLPSHYTHSVHLNQLSQALRVFALHARGPAFEHCAAQLQDECNKVWLSGRQLCEERSLTGRHCVYPYHKVPEDLGEYLSEKSKEDGSVPCKPHSSRITSLCACNCGRTQEHREDPFEIRTANYDFFKVLEDKCCAYLIHLVFPCHPCFSLSKPPDISLKDVDSADDVPLLEMPSETKSPPTNDELPGGGKEPEEQSSAREEVPEHVSGIIPIPKSALVGRERAASHGVPTGSIGQSLSSVFSLGGYHATLENASHEGTEYKSVTSMGLGGSTVGSEELLSSDHHPHVSEPVNQPEAAPVSQAQTILPTMLSDQTASGVLPAFPSWSVCRLGSSSSYQPAKGLEQPGFFPSSNFLLAWDIPLLNESQSEMTSQFDGQSKHFSVKGASDEAWPAPNELPAAAGSCPSLALHQSLGYAHRQCVDFRGTGSQLMTQGSGKSGSAGASRQRGGRNARDAGSACVRAYIGDEYECPRGHRFICSGPDKMVKATSSGHVKETAHKLVTMDMPLYFPCPCRSTKPLLAQLQRVFVCTPDSPIVLTLNPRVQPGAPPCPVFYPGVVSGVSLPPASLCVLRFPYVFVGAEGPILPPGDSQPLLSCRVLKGMFSVLGRD